MIVLCGVEGERQGATFYCNCSVALAPRVAGHRAHVVDGLLELALEACEHGFSLLNGCPSDSTALCLRRSVSDICIPDVLPFWVSVISPERPVANLGNIGDSVSSSIYLMAYSLNIFSHTTLGSYFVKGLS